MFPQRYFERHAQRTMRPSTAIWRHRIAGRAWSISQNFDFHPCFHREPKFWLKQFYPLSVSKIRITFLLPFCDVSQAPPSSSWHSLFRSSRSPLPHQVAPLPTQPSTRHCPKVTPHRHSTCVIHWTTHLRILTIRGTAKTRPHLPEPPPRPTSLGSSPTPHDPIASTTHPVSCMTGPPERKG